MKLVETWFFRVLLAVGVAGYVIVALALWPSYRWVVPLTGGAFALGVGVRSVIRR